MTTSMTEQEHQVAIIGAGPAGWTAALYLGRAGLAPLVFEGELDGTVIPGGQLTTTTEVENYPGFPNGGISGWDMVELFKKQGEEFGAITLGETITQIKPLPPRSEAEPQAEPDSQGFELSTKDKSYRVKSVIIATGATAKYLGLPSEQQWLNKGVSACATCDGALPRFRNQPIMVVGGGDTAMEEALFLARFGSKVYIAHRRDTFRASPIMAKRALAHDKIEVLWNTVIDQVVGEPEKGVTGVITRSVGENGRDGLVECAGFFVGIGHQPNSRLFQDLVDFDESGYLITQSDSTFTKTPGLFACGDVQDKTYRQAVTAAGSGCMAAIDCTRWLESLD